MMHPTVEVAFFWLEKIELTEELPNTVGISFGFYNVVGGG